MKIGVLGDHVTSISRLKSNLLHLLLRCNEQFSRDSIKWVELPNRERFLVGPESIELATARLQLSSNDMSHLTSANAIDGYPLRAGAF